MGLACAFKDGGMTHSVSTAMVRVHADGSVTLFSGAIEHGQGSTTVLAQVVAETLGVGLDKVSVTTPDTALTPYDQGTSASRTTTLMGRAVYAASLDCRQQLTAMAADLLKVEEAAVQLQDGALRAVVLGFVSQSCSEPSQFLETKCIVCSRRWPSSCMTVLVTQAPNGIRRWRLRSLQP